jgi:hypothetical protein
VETADPNPTRHSGKMLKQNPCWPLWGSWARPQATYCVSNLIETTSTGPSFPIVAQTLLRGLP